MSLNNAPGAKPPAENTAAPGREPGAARTGAAGTTSPQRGHWLHRLLLRVHFYAGVFVGPFILIAAITGALYAFAPQLGTAMHRDVVTVQPSETTVPLNDQAIAARASLGTDAPLTGVHLTGGGEATTFVYAGTGPERSYGVFVDPGTGEVTGQLDLAGRGANLPFVQWLSTFHKDLHLGQFGVWYSELAASWMGFIALIGLWLWCRRLLLKRNKTRTGGTAKKTSARGRSMSWHSWLGVAVLLPTIILAITGVTWSEHAGSKFREVRTTMGWTSPRLDTVIPATDNGGAQGESALAGDAAGAEPDLDAIVATARAEGIDAPILRLSAPMKPGHAWSVQEDMRTVPIQRDAAAVDPATMTVTNTVDFESAGIIAKAITWGILFHFGALFGFANQVLLFATALALIAIVIYGYIMWWQRRPTRAGATGVGAMYPRGGLKQAPWYVSVPLVAALAATCWYLPVLGVSVVLFLIVDAILAFTKKQRSNGTHRGNGASAADTPTGKHPVNEPTA